MTQSTCEAPPALSAGSVPREAASGGLADAQLPCILVYTALFPSAAQPLAGLFIRERMFRMRPYAPLVVVCPQPWFPLQSLIRRFVPGYRPAHARREIQDGVDVHFPRFLAFPGMLRQLDGLSMAACTYALVRRLSREHGGAILDAHFAYPAGYAAVRLGGWLRLPVAITLRGTESVHLGVRALREKLVYAVRNATRVLSVSRALTALFADQGVPTRGMHVVGNGVDLTLFKPVDRAAARRRLGFETGAKIIVSVGGLVERKGFHRVIEVLPRLVERFPSLHYLIVGGASPAGDLTTELKAQVQLLGLGAHVTFTGPLEPVDLPGVLCAADAFVLATRYEGWANVFLEAMACGLPVVTTRVGGNDEVVASDDLGTLVPFGDADRLADAIGDALNRDWDRERIMQYARENAWERRVEALHAHFRELSEALAALKERHGPA